METCEGPSIARTVATVLQDLHRTLDVDGELPEDPAAFAGRLNQLVLRGLA